MTTLANTNFTAKILNSPALLQQIPQLQPEHTANVIHEIHYEKIEVRCFVIRGIIDRVKHIRTYVTSQTAEDSDIRTMDTTNIVEKRYSKQIFVLETLIHKIISHGYLGF